MFANARLTAVSGQFLGASRTIMLTRSQLSSIKKKLVVHHDREAQMFYAYVGPHRVFVEYEKQEGDNVIKLVYTYVPKELERRGIATQLAKEAFDQIVSENQQAEVVCGFLKKVLDKQGTKYNGHIY